MFISFNLVAYAFAFITHILLSIWSMISCKPECNLYAHCGRSTFDFLNSCYCGCNKEIDLESEGWMFVFYYVENSLFIFRTT